MPALGRLAARAPDVAELMDTLGPLAGALRYGDVRGTDAAALRIVFDELVVRVVAGLGSAAEGLDDDAARAMIERMSAVQAALAVVDHPARHTEFPAVLARLAERRRVHGLVHGRATRLLHDGGQWAPPDVEARLGRALTPGTPAADGAAFVEGFLAGSGTVLLHDDQLLDVVDGWIASLRAGLVRVGRGPAAAHVRRVRAGRASPARCAAVVGPGRPGGTDGRRRRRRPRPRAGPGDGAGDARRCAG